LHPFAQCAKVFTGEIIFIRRFLYPDRLLSQQVVLIVEEEQLLIGLANIKDRYGRRGRNMSDFRFRI